MRKAEERGQLRYVGIRHEGAAAFAASAFGKLTGRPGGPALAIAGPGSTNLLTGLYDAKLGRGTGDRAVRTGCRRTSSAVAPSRTSTCRPCFRGRLGVEHDRQCRKRSGRTHRTRRENTRSTDAGVAQLVFPDEVQVVPSDLEAATPVGRSTRRAIHPRSGRPGEAQLRRSDRLVGPVIVAGAGRARGAQAELLAFAEALAAPVLTTFRAKGLVAEHPSARSGRTRTQRHAGRELADE